MIINVKVKPNARKNEVIQIDNNTFEVKTTATPENGKANQSVIELLAKFFRVGKTKINIIKGQTGRDKVVEIQNEDIDK